MNQTSTDDLLRELRKVKESEGLSAQGLRDRLVQAGFDVSTQTVQFWLANPPAHKPNADNALKLREWLGNQHQNQHHHG